MQHRLIQTQPKNDGLIVYFAGWGTPPSAVKHLALPSGYDLLLCYDYQDLRLDFDFSAYRQIRLVAWSMGVWAAERCMRHIPLLSATAVNGTGLPMHDEYGIPCAVFEGTLAGLDEANRIKFIRRMCGDKAASAQYQALTDHPSTAKTLAELTALYRALQADRRTDLINWQKAFIATADRIFLPQNQRHYWQSRCAYTEISGAHYLWPLFEAWEQLW